ncbi:BT4734/BF3469 family protein [Bacteroides sp. 224]|uniref:BT4734/BF3469 family protein n=1 Tax=Bacteroides sp. 224 TaxID=2302936 RepID=UPI0013D7E382|nr:BT4734/BF3469 family protein [Bacteroides sp. 224]NDV65730.1 hypothetical protein [Bacteroides sp. 224]
MKITQYRNDGKTQTQRTMDIEAALAAMRTEIKTKPVSVMREKLHYAMHEAKNEFIQKVPLMAFGGVFRRIGSRQEMAVYNGVVMLEVNKLADMKEAIKVRDLASTLPQTLLAFVGSSGRSTKIFIPFTLPDGTLPQNHELVEMFHAHAYRDAVKWYQPQLKREIELKKPTPNQCCRMTYDPTLFYNPQAVPIRIEQPVRMPAEPTFSEHLQEICDPLLRLLPGYERYWIIDTLFETSLWNALSSLEKVDTEEDLHPFLIRLAENCYHSGVPEEEAVRLTLVRRNLQKYDLLVRTCFRNAYTMSQKFGGKPCITSTMTLVAQLEEFMHRRYQLRRNTVKGVVEYRELKSYKFDFHPLTKQVINGMTLNITSEGVNAWDADVRRYVESDRIPVYDPIEEYLFGLPKWDGKDRIRPLAQRVKCSNKRWPDLFYTWFLSMVAHWLQLDREHANSTLPLLVGNQGCGKSTFCLNILPPELRDYYTDSIDFSNRRDVQLALNRFALINMDEFDSIGPSYQGFLKHILQKAIVQTRRPHGSSTEQLRRYATFIATSNNFDLLTDPTGSRRFICIEVEGVIDYTQPIDYTQLYAQALHAVRNKERYWFTHEEEAYITKSNLGFHQMLPEEETIFLYFRSPHAGEAFEELTCTEILERVHQRRPTFECSRSVSMRLGRILRKSLNSRKSRHGMVYQVVEI